MLSRHFYLQNFPQRFQTTMLAQKNSMQILSFSRKVFTPRVIECTGVVGFGGLGSMYRYRGFQDHSGIPVSEARIQECLWGKCK